MLQDVRYALATMRRAPIFTATALMTLALGIGGTTAVFSIVHGVLLRPLPYPESNRLVRLWEEHPGGVSPAGNRWLSRPTYAIWRESSGTLDAIGGYGLLDHTVVFDGEPVKILGSQVSPAVFGMLGATPALGRFFVPDEDQDGAERVVVLANELWRERYASRRDVLGQSLVIDGQAYTIVGVARSALEFPDARVRFWIPYAIPRSAVQTTGAAVLTTLGRLKPGVTLGQAEAEGTAAARRAPRHRLTELFFGRGGEPVVHARRLLDDMTVSVRPALSVMAIAIALVLLIACANIANLMLSRAVTRRRELAIRAAIGASQGRLLRQLFTEVAVLSAAGGALGLWLAWWLVRVLPAIAPARLPRVDEIGLNQVVAGFCALVTVMAALACGIAPAVRGARADVHDALRRAGGSSRNESAGVTARRLRDILLVVEAALAVIPIVGAGLVTHSFVRLLHVDPGYTAAGVLTASADLPDGASDQQTDRFIDAALQRLRAMPGVSSAGAGAMVPLMTRTAVMPFTIPDRLAGGKPTRGRALTYGITPGYAEALGLRLRAGRLFEAADARTDRLPMIVNEEFVRQHLSTSSAVGVTIPGLMSSRPSPSAEIVGVVANMLKDGNDRQPQPELYFVHGSHGQRISGRVILVIRTTGDPAALAPQVRTLVRQIEPGAAIDRIEPLTTAVAASVDQPRFAVAVMTAFASLAILLAVVGLAAALSYSVSQRRREMGIRAALGARPAELTTLVLREGLSRTLAGVGLGVLAATVLARQMQALLFGVAPLDAAAFTVGPLILIVTAAAACLVPALRAASTDPALTLRSE